MRLSAGHRARPLPLVLLLLAALVAGSGCGEDPEKVARRERNVARSAQLKEAAQNHCTTDDDCQVTGCHGTLCRALPDEAYCLHRLVLARAPEVPEARVAHLVTVLLESVLTPREFETLTVAPLSNGSLLASFHAPLAQRARIETLLAAQAAGGFYLPHMQSDAIANAVMAEVARAGTPDNLPVLVREAEGGLRLVEVPVAGGELVSLADVRAARERVEQLLEPLRPPDAVIATEALLAREVPVVRGWVLTSEGAVSLDRIVELQFGGTRVEGRLDADGTARLEALSARARDRALAVVVDGEVIGAPLASGLVREGVFELNVPEAEFDPALRDALHRLDSSSELSKSAWLDRVATADAEVELGCWTAQPPLARCGCVEGQCGWAPREPLEMCLATGQLPAGHTAAE